ncbi:MAG: acetate--CoA ligase family protein [Magnetococcales bacterium]|nr:acetate--CoA ligase family protein [Magnetococcales bacterium]
MDRQEASAHREGPRDLTPLLQPQAVAVVGASRVPGKIGHEIWVNLQRGGFQGALYAINPNAESILGAPCLNSIRQAPRGVDLVVIALPPEGAMEAARQAVDHGCRALVMVAEGFRERGGEGAAREAALARMCRERGVILLGPNSLGVINTHHGLNASFAMTQPGPGGVAILSQSGSVCTAALDWMAARGVGLSVMASLGNQADLTESELLDYVSRDPATRVVGCYLEGVSSGATFMRMVEETSSRLPVVVRKAGMTAAGRRAAARHTGHVMGPERNCWVGRSGAVRVEGFDAWLDALAAFSRQPLPRGGRVLIVTNAGGPGVMAADALEGAGLSAAELPPEGLEALRQRLPERVGERLMAGGPLDLGGDASPEWYGAALETLLPLPEVDGAVVIMTPQSMTQPLQTAQAMTREGGWGKPVMGVFMGGGQVIAGLLALNGAGIPSFPSPERAVAALGAMAGLTRWRERPPRVVAHFPVNQRRVQRVLHRYRLTGMRRLAASDAKEILQAYGFNVPEGELATSLEEAMSHAERLGYPVALKLCSPDGAPEEHWERIRLNLATQLGVRDAYDLMTLRFAHRHPEGRMDGVLVERMSPRGLDAAIGLTRDPQFGPLLMFGLGGRFVEVLKESSFQVAPITFDEAMEMLDASQAMGVLRGNGESGGVDQKTVAECLQRLSQLAADFPEIERVEVDPLIVGRPGVASVAAECRMVLAPESE